MAQKKITAHKYLQIKKNCIILKKKLPFSGSFFYLYFFGTHFFGVVSQKKSVPLLPLLQEGFCYLPKTLKPALAANKHEHFPPTFEASAPLKLSIWFYFFKSLEMRLKILSFAMFPKGFVFQLFFY